MISLKGGAVVQARDQHRGGGTVFWVSGVCFEMKRQLFSLQHRPVPSEQDYVVCAPSAL